MSIDSYDDAERFIERHKSGISSRSGGSTYTYREITGMKYIIDIGKLILYRKAPKRELSNVSSVKCEDTPIRLIRANKKEVKYRFKNTVYGELENGTFTVHKYE